RLHWMTSPDDLWPIAEHLEKIPHVSLIPPALGRRLSPVDNGLKAAGTLNHPGVKRAGPR
ncbi:MAG TPA: hypothetical protein VHW91_06250, partial [Candidatus Dormibacteraeota bacterium]|nr:hypothetical protein [Candidatus Dormibacteraeota bacterium]